MAGSLKVKCSHCREELTLKNRDALGKRVRCPFCDEPFLVELPKKAPSQRRSSSEPQRRKTVSQKSRPAPDQKPKKRKPPRPVPQTKSRRPKSFDDLEVVETSQDFEDYEDYDDDYGASFDDPGFDAPAPRSRSRSRKRKRRKASLAWLKPVLLIGSILAGMGAFGGAVYYAVSFVDFFGSNLNLAYLPPDAEVIVSIQVDDAWNSAFVQDLANLPNAKSAIDLWKSGLRLKPGDSVDDIKSITYGFSGLAERRGPSFNPQSAKMIVVVRFKKRIDMQDVESDSTKKTHGGKTYYISKDPNSNGLAIYIPDRKTSVIGIEKDVKAAMDRGPKTEPRPELDFVDTNQHVLFIYAPQDRSTFSSAASSPILEITDSKAKFEEAVKDHLKALCFGLTFHEGIDAQIQGDFTDAESAKTMKDVMDEVLQDGLAKLTETKQSAPSQLTELLSVAETIMQSASAQQKGTTLSITLTVPENFKSTIENLQETLPAMIGGGGAFGGSNPYTPPTPQRSRP